MVATVPYRIERLTPSLGADYLRFFDHEKGPAFADNPEWAKCSCREVPVTESWPPCDGPASRAAMAARGIQCVDAFPWNVGPDETAAADHCHDSPAMFAAAGIVEIARHDNLTVARKSLR
jgi:hypothetical protein